MSNATFSKFDYEMMATALRLAKQGVSSTQPNPRVGCVIVNQQRIVGSGWHKTAGSAHAEVLALEKAGKLAEGSTVYVTLEPCSHQGRTPPCAEALISKKVSHVIIAMKDPNPLVSGKGVEKLNHAGIRVSTGLLEDQARALNRGFISRMSRHRPWVTIKLGASLDGKTAMKSGESKWITSAESRHDVQRQRAASSAILSGIGTVLADNPSFTVRLDNVHRQPLRVILDSNLSITDDLALLNDGHRLLIATAVEETDQRFIQLIDKGVDVRRFNGPASNRVNLPELLQCLADDYACNDLLVEAGSVVSGSFLTAQLVDEVLLYIAPVIMGTEAKGLFNIPGLDTMADKIHMKICDTRAIGKDLRLTLQPEY